MNAQARLIYEALLVTGFDQDTMLVLADALEEDGGDKVARAYRWAADNRKWPWLRVARYKTDTGIRFYKIYDVRPRVYDWTTDNSALKDMSDEHKLPEDVFARMCRLEVKSYGDVHDAFVLLSRVLEAA